MKFEKAMVTIIDLGEEDILTMSGYECNTLGSAYASCEDQGYKEAAKCNHGNHVTKGLCNEGGHLNN